MKVKDILKRKGNVVKTIRQNDSIRDSVRELVENNIGALVVMEESGEIAGIITERDILRLLDKDPDDLKNISVDEIMTRNLIVCEPDDKLDYVETVMVEKRIRHLPVIENGKLIGIISIGDVVKSLLQDSKIEIKYLRDYIEGNYPN
jgi:CBS domain-containing protein